MTDCAATILIPTHNHGPTLRASVASALRQTISDIEVLVVGDGVPDETRDIMRDIVSADARVQFFDFPKGPRHGEIYRHRVLADARGRIICYLSDDDLYLPQHVETMCALLERADFAHALAGQVQPNGCMATWTVDLAQCVYQRELLASRNRIPLSAGAHTKAIYDQLAEGWTSAPAGLPTDLYMWQKFLRHPNCRFKAGHTPTVLVFPAPLRKNWTAADRVQELQCWLDRIASEQGIHELNRQILAQKSREAAEREGRLLEVAQDPRTALHETTLQVFFPAAQGYNENDSVRFPIYFGDWRQISLVVPYGDPNVPIRIDPASEPCLIQLTDITLRTIDGTVLWQLNGDNAHELQIGGTSTCIFRSGIVGILSHGQDPQLCLPLIGPLLPAGDVLLELRVKLDGGIEHIAEVFSRCLRLSTDGL